MKVPILDRQVQENPTLLPDVNISKATPGAFGENEAVAIENLGKAGQSLGNTIAEHALLMQQKEQDKDIMNRETAYRKDMQDILSNPEIQKVKINGQDVDMPKGYMQRPLWQAKGVTEQYDTNYYKNLKPKYMAGLSEYQVSKLGPALDNYYATQRDNIINHEAKELRKDYENTSLSNIDQKINDSLMITDPTKIKEAISGINADIDKAQFNGFYTYEQAQKKKEDFPMQRVKWDIYNDNATQEKDSKVLSDLKDDTKYDYLTKENRLKLIEEAQRRIFQNNQTFKRDITESQNIRHDDILDKISKETLTFQDIDKELAIPEDQGGVPKKILVSYQKSLEHAVESDLKSIVTAKDNKGKIADTAIRAKNYLNMIDNFIDNKNDMWKARELLAEAYADKILSPKEAYFFNTLTDNLKDIEFNRKTDGVTKLIKWFKGKNQNLSDEDLALKIKSLVNHLSTSDSPESVQEFIKKDNIETMPNIVSYGPKGQLHIDSDGNRGIVYNTGDIEEK